MNDLTTTPNSTPARPTSPALSPELTALLDDSGNPDRAVRQIVESGALIAEAKAALPALEAVATAKAGDAGVRAVIGRRLATYPQPARSEGEWDAWWADYFDVLSDVSLASLEAGMRAYVALPDSEFMPKPGKLRELAFSAPCRSLGRLYRARMAVRAAETEDQCERERVDPAEVRSMLADFETKMGAAAKLRPELPSIAGKVDEGGLTAQMRESMARRAGD